MKRSVALLVLSVSGLVAAGEETPLPTRPATPAEMKEARDRIDAYYKSLPLESQPVVYVIVSGKLVPAQIDPVHRIEYRWRDVALDSSLVPRLEQSGSFGIFPIKPTGLEVREISPPIRYYALPGADRFAVGYYDPSNTILYQWNRVELGRASIPRGAEAGGLIIDPTSVEISSASPPPEFARQDDAAAPPATPATATPSPATPVPGAPPAASPQPTRPVAQVPTATVEKRAPAWRWLGGILALVVIVAFALKRRA